MFLVIVFLFSACSTYLSLRRYMVSSVDGTIVTFQENLAHARTNQQGKAIDRELLSFMREKDEIIYIDETSMNEIVRLNYEGKLIQELTDEEIGSFIKHVYREYGICWRKTNTSNIHRKRRNIFVQKS